MPRFALFSTLTDAEEASLLTLAHRRRYKRGEPVFHEGDPGDTVHLIDRGHAAVRITTPAGDVATLRILGPGALFGEMAVLEPGPRSATVLALAPLETLSMHRDVVDEARRRHPALTQVMLRAALSEVRRLSFALTDALYVPVSKRLARHLLQLAKQFAGGVIPLTQDDLAGLCGSTRQSVNAVLSELQADGVLTLARGRVTVIDQDRLTRLSR